MTDLELWNRAVAAVRGEYENLGPETRRSFAGLAGALRREKREFHALTAVMGSEGRCEECGGACCRTGKYHVSVLDVLVMLSGGDRIPEPSFRGGHCPYLGPRGCQMEPSLRPFPCITFHCDETYGLLKPAEAERLFALENEIRACCRAIEELFGKPLMKSLLLRYENDLPGPGSGIAPSGAELFTGGVHGNYDS